MSNEFWTISRNGEELCHYGVKGMKWKEHLKAKAVEVKYKIGRRLNPSAYKERMQRAALEKTAVARKQTVGSTGSLYRQYEPRADISNRAEKAIKKARTQRSAKPQADTIRAGQQQTRSLIDKIHKKHRTAKAALAAGLNEARKGAAIINKHAGTKVGVSYDSKGKIQILGSKYGESSTRKNKLIGKATNKGAHSGGGIKRVAKSK